MRGRHSVAQQERQNVTEGLTTSEAQLAASFGSSYALSGSEDVNRVICIPYPETSTLWNYETPERAFHTIRELLAWKGVTFTRIV